MRHLDGIAAVPTTMPPPYATPTEREIASVWCEVLGLPAVGATDNFFDVGGTSRAAVVVRERLGHRLGRPVSEVALFQYPTVRALAAHLDGTAGPAAEGAAAQRAARRGAARHVPGRRGAGRHGPGPGRVPLPVRHEEE
jgi:mycobactin peptide synthetase MbtE